MDGYIFINMSFIDLSWRYCSRRWTDISDLKCYKELLRVFWSGSHGDDSLAAVLFVSVKTFLCYNVRSGCTEPGGFSAPRDWLMTVVDSIQEPHRKGGWGRGMDKIVNGQEPRLEVKRARTTGERFRSELGREEAAIKMEKLLGGTVG